MNDPLNVKSDGATERKISSHKSDAVNFATEPPQKFQYRQLKCLHRSEVICGCFIVGTGEQRCIGEH